MLNQKPWAMPRPLFGPWELRLPVRRVLRCLQALDVANHAIGEAVSALGTLDASVLQTHLKRIRDRVLPRVRSTPIQWRTLTAAHRGAR